MNETIYANRVFDFLKELEVPLRNSKYRELVERLQMAMTHYTFPLTSEFLGIAMTALDAVALQSPEPVSAEQIQTARSLADGMVPFLMAKPLRRTV